MVEDLVDVWEWSPWTFENNVLVLKKWTPYFHPSRDSIDLAPLWIRLPRLPMEYWNKSILISIASKAGKVLRIDENCLSFDRGLYARACVEVDLTKSLVPGTNVSIEGEANSFFQPFVYEKIPKICFGCGCVGHQLVNCPQKAPSQVPTSQPSAGDPSIDCAMKDVEVGLDPEPEYAPLLEPWIQAKGHC